jgi:hypothetical protein
MGQLLKLKRKQAENEIKRSANGGSATLTFTSHQQATHALQLLQTFAKENERNYKVRFAFVVPEPEPVVSKELTEERIELRKARAM